MKRLLEPWTETSYALLRIMAGAMFSFHGVQKIFGVLQQHGSPRLLSQAWFGGVIELVAGTLIAAGAWTRCAAFVASGEMAVAYVQFHWRLAFDSKFVPAINRGELALLYSFLFLFIACRGAGRFSVDGRRG